MGSNSGKRSIRVVAAMPDVRLPGVDRGWSLGNPRAGLAAAVCLFWLVWRVL